MSLDSLLGMRLEDAQRWLRQNGCPEPLTQFTRSPRGEQHGEDARVVRALWQDEKPLLTVAIFQTQIGE